MIIRARCADLLPFFFFFFPFPRALKTCLGAVFAGGGRSAFTSGREGARDGTDVIRLVRTPPQSVQTLILECSSFSSRWTGEVDGQSGLFPATYVKLL